VHFDGTAWLLFCCLVLRGYVLRMAMLAVRQVTCPVSPQAGVRSISIAGFDRIIFEILTTYHHPLLAT